MPITKIIDTEVNTETSAGAATSIGSATCVRLYNITAGIVTVGLSTIVGAATTNYFAIPSGSVEFLAKLGSDVIWTSGQIKANKVAFTN
jgi:hypothetical protein